MCKYRMKSFRLSLLMLLRDSYSLLANMARPAPTPSLQDRLETQGIRVSGFLDVACTPKFNNPNTTLIRLPIFDADAASVSPHLVRLI